MQEQIYIVTHDGKPIGITEAAESMGPLSWFHHNKPAYSMDHALQHEGYGYTEGEPDCHDVAGILEGIADRVGIVAEFEFVPFSRSENAKPRLDGKPWPSLNWRVTLKRRMGGREILTTDYAQGAGYCPADKAKWDTAYEKARAVNLEIETGKVARRSAMTNAPATTVRAIDPPRLGDVLQSLAQDADVLDAGGFEDWAANYGYDTDSRKAEAIYRACVEIATKLRAGLGARTLEEMQLAARFN